MFKCFQTYVVKTSGKISKRNTASTDLQNDMGKISSSSVPVRLAVQQSASQTAPKQQTHRSKKPSPAMTQPRMSLTRLGRNTQSSAVILDTQDTQLHTPPHVYFRGDFGVLLDVGGARRWLPSFADETAHIQRWILPITRP